MGKKNSEEKQYKREIGAFKLVCMIREKTYVYFDCY
jgi:hypothetical protein